MSEPLRAASYILTTGDALAYEQAMARTGLPGTLAFIVWLGLCAAGALLIPPDWIGPRLGWSFDLVVAILAAIGAVIALLLASLIQWRRARRWLKRPTEFQLEEWPDHLKLSSAGKARTVAFGEIRRVELTRTHLLLETTGEPVILPRRAFLEHGAVEALADRIRKPPPPPAVDPAKASA